MKVETYLKQGMLLDQRINYLLKKLGDVREAACNLPSTTVARDKVQASPSGDAPFVRALERVEEMQEQINREIDKLADLRQQIMDVIGQVDGEELRMVLVYRYLEGMTLEKIGDMFCVDKSTIKRWLKIAMEQITLPEDAIIARTRF